MTVFLPARRRSAGYVASWCDPLTGRRRQQTLGARTRRDAYRLAGELADQIVRGVDPRGLSWLEFCRLYELQHLAGRSAASRESWRTVKWYVEELAPLASVHDATPAWVSRFQQALRRRGLAANSVATYSARLRAALRWADRQQLIDRAPHVAVDVEEVPASRGITTEEFERILAAVPKIRPDDASQWQRFLRGLSWCNLRVGELARLSWDPDGEIRMERHGGYPLIHLPPRSHKARKDRWQPVLPEFWAVCAETPEPDRAGLVFPLVTSRGQQFSRKRIIRVIAEIGRRAGVVTNPDRGKCATSHDIGRRAFLPKVDGRLSLPELHKLMGHASFQTTIDYYDTRAAEEIAAKLWETSK